MRNKLIGSALTVAGAMVALGAGAAHATTYGDPGLPNPFSIASNDGLLRTLDTSGHEISAIALPYDATHVAWSGQGGRFAYASASAVWTADYDGSHTIKVASLASGQTVGALKWDGPGEAVLFTARTNSAPIYQLYAAPADGSYVQYGIAPAVVLNAAQLTAAGMSDGIEAFDMSAKNTMAVEGPNASIRIVSFDHQGNPTFSPAFTGYTGPTISPDGTTVVAMSMAASNYRLFSASFSGGVWSTPVQVTWYNGTQAHPQFLVDGTHVVYEASNDGIPAGTGIVDITKSVQPDGSTPGSNPTQKILTPLEGTLGTGYAIRTDVKSQVTRFAGATRYDTAVQASQAQWRNHGDTADLHRQQAQSVVIARGDVFADALGGAGLASAKHGPLLLTDPNTLTDATLTEVQRVLSGGGTVYVLGGTGAVSPAVASALIGHSYNVVRIGGSDRFATATAIAGQITSTPSRVLVATGQNFPDALSAGAVTAEFPGTVVVLTDNNSMPASTQKYISDANTASKGTLEIWGIGQQGVNALAAAGWGNKIYAAAGSTRYMTSFLVTQDFFGGAGTISLATGNNAPDALSAGAFMGRLFGPLLLVDPQSGLSPEENAWIDSERGSTSFGFIFGGTGALPASIDGQLGADISTATGVTIGTFNGVTPLSARPQPAQGTTENPSTQHALVLRRVSP